MISGVAWYREDQWELLKSTAADPEEIEDTYQEWLKGALNLIKTLKRQGLDVCKVDLDVGRFNDWCQMNRRVPNGESRAEYVAELVRHKHGSLGETQPRRLRPLTRM